MLDDGKAAFQAVCGLDLEGIVAKRVADSYGPRNCGLYCELSSVPSWMEEFHVLGNRLQVSR